MKMNGQEKVSETGGANSSSGLKSESHLLQHFFLLNTCP